MESNLFDGIFPHQNINQNAKRRAGDVEGKCTGCGMLRHTRQNKSRKWCQHISGCKYCGIFRPLKRKREEDEEEEEEEDEEDEEEEDEEDEEE